ncbi:NfeD family protein [Methanothermobacter sp.]|uniref:NfeD family protein n=1 Tax=Methanothermobacter sp. TaxID=1884223 RepID=UPI00262AD5DB|nr:NfeD family protein [Methanothermobacter sp.]MDI9618355.1 NfeD family protein [Methanothermobacter sp.]
MGPGSWVIIAAICLIGEMLTAGFFLLWFAFGALAAAALGYIGFDTTAQFVTFIVVSVILLAISRPFAARITGEPSKKAAADRLIGREGTVTEAITPQSSGLVRVDGETWRARSDAALKEGDLVKVKAIEGVKLVVEKVEE